MQKIKPIALAAAFAIAMLAASAAAAQVAIEPVTAGGVTVSLPRGWKTTADASHGTFVAQQDPGRLDAAAMIVVVQPSGVTATADQLVDKMLAQAATDVKVIQRTHLQGGGSQVIAEGNAGEVQARIGVIVMVSNGGAVTGLLASRIDQFDSLGGIGFVSTVLASIKANATPASTQPGPMNAPPTQSSQPVDLAKGRLPQLARPIAIGDLTGTWKDAGSGISNWYSAQTGTFVGSSAILSSATYYIAGDGSYRKDATHVALGNTVASVTSQDTGVIQVAGPSVIEISINNKSGPTWHGWYVIRGWYVNGGQTVMKLNGPWQPRADGSLDPEAFNLDAFGKNTYYWIRANR